MITIVRVTSICSADLLATLLQVFWDWGRGSPKPSQVQPALAAGHCTLPPDAADCHRRSDPQHPHRQNSPAGPRGWPTPPAPSGCPTHRARGSLSPWSPRSPRPKPGPPRAVATVARAPRDAWRTQRQWRWPRRRTRGRRQGGRRHRLPSARQPGAPYKGPTDRGRGGAGLGRGA